MRHVRRCGQKPERREPEGEDRTELDDVATRFSDGELLGRLLELSRNRSGRALDTTDELDGDAEEVLRRGFVETGRADKPWKDELCGLVHGTSARSGAGTNDSLGKRKQEPNRAEHPLARGLGGVRLRADGDSTEEGETVEDETRCLGVAGVRRINCDASADRVHVRLDSPPWWHPDGDTP